MPMSFPTAYTQFINPSPFICPCCPCFELSARFSIRRSFVCRARSLSCISSSLKSTMLTLGLRPCLHSPSLAGRDRDPCCWRVGWSLRRLPCRAVFRRSSWWEITWRWRSVSMIAPKGTTKEPIERADVRVLAVTSRCSSSRRREDMVSRVVS